MPHRPPSSLSKPLKRKRTSISKSASTHIATPHLHEYNWGDQGSDTEGISGSQNHSYRLSSDLGLEDDEDADAPRTAQWEDNQAFEIVEDSQESSVIHALQVGALTSNISNLIKTNFSTNLSDLSGLPLGALRKARSVLAPAIDDFDIDYSDGTKSSVELEGSQHEHESVNNTKTKSEWSLKPRPDIAKRASKNAPMETTSKRPVTRKRNVVEVKQVQARDPRFLPLAGEFSGEKFQQHYSFLAESHKTELKTLQINLKRARILLASSPQGLLSERQQEVKRLELTVKRAESIVNSDRRNKVEREALVKVALEEKNRRKGGKGGWWLKESEKRDLLVRARYDALVAEGGKQAVKKAIGKKQKKLGQKEKKSRPFAKEGSARPQLHRKRGPSSAGQENGQTVEKRRRVG